MAPTLTVDLKLAFELPTAPHMLKVDAKTTTNDTMEPEAEIPVPQKCQICFDDCIDEATTVTKFCGTSCPAMLCRDCLAEHVRLSVAKAFPGVLPRVRCPICLVAVGKAAWQQVVSADVVTQYVKACRTACSYQTPCCHDSTYTHLPRELDAADLPSRYIKPKPLELEASLEAQLELLHTQTRRFCDREITSKDWIVFLEDTFGRHVDVDTQLLILEHELPQILDEERRATLLLSYHAKYKAVTTRCCGTKTCFNCKRHMSSHTNADATTCDVGELAADCIVECRSCHVTMVKVEGCNSVRCWCGFSMDWGVEVRLRDRNKKQLIPIDIYDIKLHTAWATWQQTLTRIVANEVLPLRLALRLSRIDQQLTMVDGLRKTLRRVVQRPYIWRRRFARLLPKMQAEMVRVRMLVLAKRLRKCEDFVVAIGRAKWRRYFSRVLPQLTNDIAAKRLQLCTTRLGKAASFVDAVRRAKWRACWTRVVKSIHAKQFWLCYMSEHRDEQLALHKEEMAMLLPGF